jgi:hypothetical protein
VTSRQLTAGDRVTLLDARGCWTSYCVEPTDQPTLEGGLFLHGDVWQSLHFWATGLLEDADPACPILQSATPAIGPADQPYCPLYLPAGWNPPRGVEEVWL